MDMGKKRSKKWIGFLVILAIVALYWGYIQVFGTCPFGLHMDNGPATCTKDKKCVLCGLVFQEHYGHKYDLRFAKDKEIKDCDENLWCSVCYERRIPTAEHQWEVSVEGFSEECSVCGKIKIYGWDETKIKTNVLTKDEKAEAIAMAQEMVKAELKAPSTASFPWDASAYTITKSGNQYTVKGYVDAQNSFGAKIRSTFEACFTYEMVGTKYKIHKVYTLIY